MSVHRHGGHSHDHEGGEDPDHRHHLPAAMVGRPDVVDPDTGTGCGHIGTDPGVARILIRHRGREWVLCGDCGNAFDWEVTDAALDVEEAPPTPAEDGAVE